MDSETVPSSHVSRYAPHRLSTFWRTSPAARTVIPVACLVYDVMMVTRLVFVGRAADRGAWSLTQRGWWGLPLLVMLCLASVTALSLRTRRPFAVLCSTCAMYLCGSAFAVRPYLWPQLCAAVYCCVALAGTPYACAGIVLTAASLTAGAWMSGPYAADGSAALPPMALLTAAVVALALWSRILRLQRKNRARIEAERARTVAAAAQRDAMEAWARLSAELHDGDAILTPRITREVLEHGVPRPAGVPAGTTDGVRRDGGTVGRDLFDALSPRELDVASLVAEGLTNAEIGERLVIQPDSVKRTVTRILARLGMRDRVQIVVAWYRTGMRHTA